MSIRLHNRSSSKKKKFPECSAQMDLLRSLGLEPFRTSPLGPASMLDISTWTLENPDPVRLSDLPYAFLRRLWLFSPDARSSSITFPSANVGNGSKSTDAMMKEGEERECPLNPLDLVTAVFMSSNSFLQQEIVSRMIRCRFAVPLVLPNIDPKESDFFLLWPFRSVFCQRQVISERDLVSTPVPLVSFVRIGHGIISKSKVLNHLMQCEAFLHKGSVGGQQPHRLANGMVEIAWYLPSGDASTNVFPVPTALANLRGDACAYEKNLTFLCQASSVIVIFCGTLQDKESQLIHLCTNSAKKVIIVDISDGAEEESSAVRFYQQSNTENNFNGEIVLQAKNTSEEDLAKSLGSKLKVILTEHSTHVSLLAMAELALKNDLNVDEGLACRRALALAEQVLKDLEKGSVQYQEKQLPLQGHLWRKLAEIEKKERKHKEVNTDIYQDCIKEKKEILKQLSKYKLTPAMKIFTDALFTNNKMERTYFLSWMKLKLTHIQNKTKSESGNDSKKDQILNGFAEQATESENRLWNDREDSDSFCTDSSFEAETIDDSAEQQHPQQHGQGASEDQTGKKEQLCLKPELFVLGLQHFLREMGLIYQFIQNKLGRVRDTVLQLPSLAVDLLLYGVPLEIMDGDASNIPLQWLASVFAELQRQLPQQQLRTKVLTSIGAHGVGNAELLSALFNVSFFEGRQSCSRGIYMLALCVPADLQKDLNCNFLLLFDVEGLCSGDEQDFNMHDDEMATVAAGLSDILLENISAHPSSKFENIFSVLANALLHVRDSGPIPICQIISHDDNIYTTLQASQLNLVYHILQSSSEIQNTPRTEMTTVIGPWNNERLSEVVELQYGNAILTLKRCLIDAIKKSSSISQSTSLPLWMERLCSIWDAVKTSAFSVTLQKNDIALSFSILCSELSLWESTLEEHMERWLMEAIKKIVSTKTRALDPVAQNDLLNQLKNEAQAKVISEVDAVTLQLEAHCMKDQYLKIYSDTLKPLFTRHTRDLKDRVTDMVIEKLVRANENHCSSSQMRTFQILLQKEQEIKLHELLDQSKTSKVLQNDQNLEEEFEEVWNKTMCSVDLQPSGTEDITPKVKAVLRQNFISRGLHKYMKTIEMIGQNPPEAFQICDEHIVNYTRNKPMFEDHKKNLRLQTQHMASSVIYQYNQFIAEKSSLHLEFSESYISELLEKIEKAMTGKNIEVQSAFEGDLKVYICGVACKDLQKLHDNFIKDKLLASITATKTASLTEFMYQFRKRDQGQRVAQAFTVQVIKPVVLDYIYAPLGMQIVTEIQSQNPQYQSPVSFYQSFLEELLSYDHYENFVDAWLSYDTFRQRKIQESVLGLVSNSNFVNKWRQRRLGEIIGKIVSAVSQTGEAQNGRLSDVKSLLEEVYLTLENDIDVDITRSALEGPLFDISTYWDRFVTYLIEELAAMRLELSQEFTKPIDASSLLQKLSPHPQDYLFERLRGCKMSCPSCRAPCEANDRGHEVHRVSLHRPNGLLLPELAIAAENISITTEVCEVTPSPDPEMKMSCDAQSTTPSPYWRYVLAKFSEHRQSVVPENWKKTTRDEALDDLKRVFNAKQQVLDDVLDQTME